jgi:hypothetical protein
MREQLETLNADLKAALALREKAGVVDIKGHVEVTAATEPSDVKRALVTVLGKAQAGNATRLSLQEFGSFDELYDKYFAA